MVKALAKKSQFLFLFLSVFHTSLLLPADFYSLDSTSQGRVLLQHQQTLSCIQIKQTMIMEVFKKYLNAFALYNSVSENIKNISLQQQKLASCIHTLAHEVASQYVEMQQNVKLNENYFGQTVQQLAIRSDEISEQMAMLRTIRQDMDTMMHSLDTTMNSDDWLVEALAAEFCDKELVST